MEFSQGKNMFVCTHVWLINPKGYRRHTEHKQQKHTCVAGLLKIWQHVLLIFIVSLSFTQKLLIPLKRCILSQNPPLAIMIRAPSMHQWTCHMGINQVRYHMMTLGSLIGQQLKRAYANTGAYHLHYKMVVCLLLIKTEGHSEGKELPGLFVAAPLGPFWILLPSFWGRGRLCRTTPIIVHNEPIK